MPAKLFREEAVSARQVQWLGAIRIGRPLSFSVVVAVAVSLVVLLVVFGVQGEITRKARLSGLLMPIDGTFNLVAPQSGELIELRIKEGDSVRSGDVLALMSTDRATHDGTLAKLIARTLNDRRASLEAERRIIERQATDRLDSLGTRLRNLEVERIEAQSELDATQRRVQLAKKSVERYGELVREGFVSDIQAQQKQEELLDLEVREGGARRVLTATARDKLILEAEQKSIVTTLETQQAQVEGSLAALQKDVVENGARGQVAIISPRDAIVSAISSNTGQTLQLGRSVMTLVPRDGERLGELEAQLYSPSRSAGFTQPGQEVWLRVTAYPYQKFGMVRGYVKAVSRTPINAQDLPQGQAQALTEAAQTTEPLYRVDISLSQQAISAYGKPQFFKAGMSVQADVIQERRAIWEWMLEPVLATSGNMRMIFGAPTTPLVELQQSTR